MNRVHQHSNCFLTSLLALFIGLMFGCLDGQRLEAAETSGAPASSGITIHIGYQRYGSLNILKAHGTLEHRLASSGVKVQWLLFQAGPQLLEGLNSGSIDFGSTGESPPIFAQAAGVPFIYVGNEPPNPDSEAILVPAGSTLRSVKDLKGKKIALNKGSNVHYFLVKALEANGLSYSDVQVEFLRPADARSAFEQGHVDAWAIWDPFLTAARVATKARILVDGTRLVANREFFIAQRDFEHGHADLISIVLDEINKADSWALQKPRDVAELLAPDVGVDPDVLEEIAKRQARGVQPITADTIAEQQHIADVFLSLNVLPSAIRVHDATDLK